MAKLLGFEHSVPSSWDAGQPAGGAGVSMSTATPYLDADAMPGTYYRPGAHPYETRLPNGLTVQEAYPGQYYVPHPGMSGIGDVLAKFRIIKMSPAICALIGAVVAGGVAFGVMRKKPKKARNMAIGAAASTGAALGYLVCGKKEPAPLPAEQPPAGIPGGLPTGPPSNGDDVGGGAPGGGSGRAPGRGPTQFNASLLLPQFSQRPEEDLYAQVK